MAIAKTAGKNVAFKVAKMRESIMEDQDELLIRKLEYEEVDLETNNKAVLEEVGQNADLYIVYRQSRGQHAKLEIRRLASAEFWTTSNDEVVVVGRLTS